MITRFLYALVLLLLLPYAWLHLWLRARKQPQYLEHVGERFGRYRAPRDCGASPPPLIWLHAVSVGETRAAAPLVAALRERYPHHRFLITHMTPTGRQTGEALFGATVERAYLPYDYNFAVRRFLARYRPVLGILLETELWPNLAHACRKQGVPLLLVNARLSEKSARRYARFARLTRFTLNDLSAIAAQGEADARRLRTLGARSVEVLGNLKFDLLPPAQQIGAGKALRASIGARPVLLAASTREGEEALLLAAFARRPHSNTLLIVVPRHPQRFEEVAQRAQLLGLTVQRRSENTPVHDATRVLLGDSMGELFAYYVACDVAFVGGSLLDQGCQNLIEPCAVGRPVLFGPSVYNFAAAAEASLACGAARQIGTVGELLETAEQLLADAPARARMAEAGLEFAARHRGATARTLELISRVMR